MAKSWVNSAERIGADLHLELELSGQGGRRAALIHALREAVRSGRLSPGTRLPRTARWPPISAWPATRSPTRTPNSSPRAG